MLFFVVVFALLIYKKVNLGKFNLYLNILLFVFILVDCTNLISITVVFSNEKRSLLVNKVVLTKNFHRDTAKMRDVYYLLFDSYPNCELAKSQLPPGSFSLDTFLVSRKFYLAKNSKSNYNNTPFSMDATLNMQYLDKLRNPEDLTPLEYNKALFDINHARIFNYMTDNGYKIYNLSAFIINNIQPISMVEFATVSPEEMFLYNTLSSCIMREIGWNFGQYLSKQSISHANTEAFYYDKKINERKLGYNNTLLDSVGKITQDIARGSRFVYAHFFMPHYPYFYSENGIKYADSSIYFPKSVFDNKRFNSYLQYTNKRISVMLDDLVKKTKGESIIIVQSDHGYWGYENTTRGNQFRNVSAFFFPDQNYSALYNSITNVNTFRVLINTLFSAGVPMLADSCIVLND